MDFYAILCDSMPTQVSSAPEDSYCIIIIQLIIEHFNFMFFIIPHLNKGIFL